MPQGYTYSKQQGKFVKKKTEEAFDYSSINKKSAALLVSFFRWYPDYFLDLVRADSADHKLELLQRVILRIMARYRIVHITGCRGGTKTYLMNTEKMEEGVLYPNEKMGYVAPVQKQGANLGSDAYKEIERDYPILTSYWKIKNDRDDKFRIYTDFGSEWTMYIPRGSNKSQLGIEEMGQENPEPFPMTDFKTTVSPTLRLKRIINQVEDKVHINFKRAVITNASDRTNLCYSVYRRGALKAMLHGDPYEGFCLDFTWKSVLLCNIRDIQYFKSLFEELTPTEKERELCAHYTGATEDCIINDETLSRSRKLKCAEFENNDEKAIWIVSQDIAYEDGKRNAKIGRVVGKLTEFRTPEKPDKYKCQIVCVEGFAPQGTVYQQAMDLKECWKRYWRYGAEPTYLVIDFQGGYGRAVGENLCRKTTDGSKPLCIYKHASLTELEQPDALPLMLGVKSTGRGAFADSEMQDYAASEFRQGNVELLTADRLDGLEQYKLQHNIKDILSDGKIIQPYNKTQELCEQIKNIRVINGKESRRSQYIQRDLWSALKYLLWMKKLLEDELLLRSSKRKSGWDELISNFKSGQAPISQPTVRQGDRSRLIGLRNIRR